MAFGASGQFRDREAVNDLEEAGANRVTIRLDNTRGAASLREMEEIARMVPV